METAGIHVAHILLSLPSQGGEVDRAGSRGQINSPQRRGRTWELVSLHPDSSELVEVLTGGAHRIILGAGRRQS